MTVVSRGPSLTCNPVRWANGRALVTSGKYVCPPQPALAVGHARPDVVAEDEPAVVVGTDALVPGLDLGAADGLLR